MNNTDNSKEKILTLTTIIILFFLICSNFTYAIKNAELLNYSTFLIVNQHKNTQDYFLYSDNGKIHLGKVDIMGNIGNVLEDIYTYSFPINDPKDKIGSLLVSFFTIFSDEKKVLFNSSQFAEDSGFRLIEANLLSKSWSDYYPPPVKIVEPQLSRKNYFACYTFVKPHKPIPYYTLSYSTAKNKIIALSFPFQVKHFRPPSWNVESNLICICSLDNLIYVVDLSGKYHSLSKGTLGSFSPINSRQIAIFESSESLALITFDKDFKVISKDRLIQLDQNADIMVYSPPVWSLDGKRIYYLIKRGKGGHPEVGSLECVDVKTKSVIQLTPATNWMENYVPIHPPQELLDKISKESSKKKENRISVFLLCLRNFPVFVMRYCSSFPI